MSCNRRTFLVAGGAAVAAGAAFPSALAAPRGDRIRLGFVGVGGRGTHHLREALSFPDIDVVAVCDIRPEAMAQAQAALGKAGKPKAREYADWRKLLEDKEVDAVISATPPDVHAATYLDTIAAGKDLYAEKPLCVTRQECDAVVAAAERAKCVVQVGFQGRYSVRNRAAIERIHRGDLGEIVEMRSAYLASFGPLRGWQSKRARSGDWAVEQAVHFFDQMNWIFKAVPVSAYGWGRRDIFSAGEPDRDVTDYYSALIRYPGEGIVNWLHSWLCPRGGGFDGQRHQVMGRAGAVDMVEGVVRFMARPDAPEALPADPEDSTRLAHRAFYDCIRSGDKPFSNVHNGRDSVLASLLVREAVDRRQEVSFKELFG
jgi:predicted dehydrogenase